MPNPLMWPITSSADTGPVPVGVLEGIILAANPNREDADITNTSAVWIYLARGNAAVVGAGQALSPNGGTYHIGLFNLYLGAIHAIAAGAGGTVAISEGSKP